MSACACVHVCAQSVHAVAHAPGMTSVPPLNHTADCTGKPVLEVPRWKQVKLALEASGALDGLSEAEKDKKAKEGHSNIAGKLQQGPRVFQVPALCE